MKNRIKTVLTALLLAAVVLTLSACELDLSKPLNQAMEIVEPVSVQIVGKWANESADYYTLVEFTKDGAFTAAKTNLWDETCKNSAGTYQVDDKAKQLTLTLDGETTQSSVTVDENSLIFQLDGKFVQFERTDGNTTPKKRTDAERIVGTWQGDFTGEYTGVKLELTFDSNYNATRIIYLEDKKEEGNSNDGIWRMKDGQVHFKWDDGKEYDVKYKFKDSALTINFGEFGIVVLSRTEEK